MADFSIDIRRWVEKTKGDIDLVIRKIAIDLHTRIVMRSPVGNPELWAANAEAALQRSTHNAIVDQLSANLMSDPANVTAKGNLRRSVRSKSNRRLSKAGLATAYPFSAGQGYAGGAFRKNWQVTVGAPTTTTVPGVDPTGAQAIADAQAALSTFTAGPSIFILNNLPYALRLEYEGHSKQAPAGMVRVTVSEFQQFVNDAVQSTTRS